MLEGYKNFDVNKNILNDLCFFKDKNIFDYKLKLLKLISKDYELRNAQRCMTYLAQFFDFCRYIKYKKAI